jgi:protein-tyrosine phosphatase
MLAEGWVHVLASDAHGCRARRPLFHRAFQRVAELVGWEGAIMICCDNPAAISEGRADTKHLPPRTRRHSMISWWPWRRAG